LSTCANPASLINRVGDRDEVRIVRLLLPWISGWTFLVSHDEDPAYSSDVERFGGKIFGGDDEWQYEA
jgi:hypothetical protein